MKIAILGAESTGKSELAEQLKQHFQTQGSSVSMTPEYLRTWCNNYKRTPQKEEQFAIAQAQIKQIDTAAACDFLVADTSALTIAIYSDLLFDDASLYDMAMVHQRTFDATLLMGLDLAWVADGIQRDGAHIREPVDSLLRTALNRGGIPYKVVYGAGAARLENALRCLSQENPFDDFPSFQPGNDNRGFNWHCERCSDPVCEHRLFSDLLK